MERQLYRFILAAACCVWPFASALPGEFVVSPIRLDLGPSIRSGAITLRNESTERIGFQVEAMEWQQDADGKDQYVQTQDLVFFPKIMMVEGGQEGLIRVGTKRPVVPAEKTYRLFIQELPSTNKAPEQNTAQVNFLIRFGAPVFVAPLKSHDGLEIGSLDLANGEISLSARNSGNRHQMVQNLQLKGADGGGNEVYALTIADRYLLAGTTKHYAATVPPEQCARLASLTVELKTDRLSTARKLDVTRSMCR